jgi:flagellar hook assembly protein FlgD
LQLKRNYPNPFNNQTKISYSIKTADFVRLKVYDMQGRLMATLVQQRQPAGSYSVVWNAQLAEGLPAPSGIYLIRLETDHGIEMRKALLLK